jgi:DNA adenine methylase
LDTSREQAAEPVIKLDISEERLPPPGQHPSGKRRLRALLVKLMPDHEIYCEPFCGLAGVFFAKPRSKKEILNDVNPEYIGFLKFLRDASDADWEKIKAMEWRPSERRWEELRVSKPDSNIGRVYRIMYLMRYGYRGNTGPGNYAPSRASSGFPQLLFDRRQAYKERLRDVVILNKDFEGVMQEYDSANTLFFLDPPYLQSPGMREGGQHFPGSSPEEAEKIFIRLTARLHSAKGKWILTHSWNTKARDALERLGHLRTVTVTEPTAYEGELGSRREMIAANFKLPERLRIVYVSKGTPVATLILAPLEDSGSQDLRKIPVKEINPSTLRREDAKQVLNLHLRMHQLWGLLDQHDSLDGTTREDIANAHYFVAQELARRDFRHFMHDFLDDTLQEAPLGKTMQKIYVERAKPAWRIFELEDLQEIDAFKPENAELVLEVKWDGERIQSQKHNGRVEIWSDYPRRVDHRLPHQVKELEAMKLDNFRLDSEAVMLEPESKETLHRTMVTALLNGKFDPTERAKILHLIVFDCLEFDGKDLRDQPLTERIKFLKEFTGTDHIHLLTDYLSEDPGKDALAYLIPRSHKRFEATIDKLMEK